MFIFSSAYSIVQECLLHVLQINIYYQLRTESQKVRKCVENDQKSTNMLC